LGPNSISPSRSAGIKGIEDICDVDHAAENTFELAAGRYSILVSLLDWKADPDSVGSDGRPLPTGLPDFLVLVLVRPEAPVMSECRTAVETFARA
jgi:hypothetical protein